MFDFIENCIKEQMCTRKEYRDITLSVQMLNDPNYVKCLNFYNECLEQVMNNKNINKLISNVNDGSVNNFTSLKNLDVLVEISDLIEKIVQNKFKILDLDKDFV